MHVVTEPAALGHACQQRVELGGVGLQRAGRGRAGAAGGHRGGGLLAANKTMNRTAEAHPKLNKLPK